jgi:hypothetical protein
VSDGSFSAREPSPLLRSAIAKAADAVRVFYEQIDFNPEALPRWGVAAEVGQYEIVDDVREQGAA